MNFSVWRTHATATPSKRWNRHVSARVSNVDTGQTHLTTDVPADTCANNNKLVISLVCGNQFSGQCWPCVSVTSTFWMCHVPACSSDAIIFCHGHRWTTKPCHSIEFLIWPRNAEMFILIWHLNLGGMLSTAHTDTIRLTHINHWNWPPNWIDLKSSARNSLARSFSLYLKLMMMSDNHMRTGILYPIRFERTARNKIK